MGRIRWRLARVAACSAMRPWSMLAIAALFAQAEQHWDTYVARAAATAGEDRWLAIARVRRERARAERTAADARAAKAGRAPHKNESTGEEHAL